ncbi:hypothetical protein [Flagellimonas aequoris]|uniref:Uncharacterized protein n=1 Tax=Flagellimonas aequoris TaxID=2306997 RepID=A0A418N6G7_9FLAO|nr:hypothetical protein [Allomuricauda aequoris]RIV69915.1 hypothetical protein D2U88_12255 [Allomuricauda aequoris]TXK01502.1 hypothetical protein FQ019_12140 [Allomuricauda aequoris]
MLSVKRPLIILITVAFLLLIPFIAMQFTNEVQWSLMDFVVAGILLSGVGFSVDLAIRKAKTPNKRLLWVSAIIILFLVVWAELAVGVFGTPLAGS